MNMKLGLDFGRIVRLQRTFQFLTIWNNNIAVLGDLEPFLDE